MACPIFKTWYDLSMTNDLIATLERLSHAVERIERASAHYVAQLEANALKNGDQIAQPQQDLKEAIAMIDQIVAKRTKTAENDA